MLSLLLLSIAIAIIPIQGISAEQFNPYVEGPHEVLFKRYRINETGLEKTLDVWGPREGGLFNPIIFTGSLAAILPSNGTVDTVIARIASWGYVIIAPWRPLLSPDYHTNFVDPTVEYLEGRLKNDWVELGADRNFSIDFSRMILMGHSSGNHINVNYLRNKCGGFVAAIFMSPVDGRDPLGVIPDFCITPGEKVNFTIPTLTMQAGLDSVKGTILSPACAPAKLSNKRFYDAMNGDKWFSNASIYGHADFFEPGFVETIEFLSFCASDPNSDKEIYRNFTAGSVVAFLKAIMDPEKYCDMLAYVEEPSEMIVGTNSERNAPTRCQPSACTHFTQARSNSY